MKALVYHGPGQRAWEETPHPAIQNPTDAIVRITTSTICGTDLHILKGDLPTVTPGRILGHEGIGVVMEVGTAVTAVHPGDTNPKSGQRLPSRVLLGDSGIHARTNLVANRPDAVEGLTLRVF
jgi:NADPH:quinone reductase-like Zn-dependent oxidoreductase